MECAPASVRLVPAGPGHREFVRRLSAEVFARFGDYATILPRMMRLPWVRTVVAQARGRPVGFAICSLEQRIRGEIELAAVAVLPGWQSRGVGRALLARVEREACRLAPANMRAAVRLTVAEDNLRARRVFEAAGFRPVSGEQGRYPAGQPSLSLRKVLERPGLDSGGPRPELE
jgi:ribosomal protein S18 acetylase RimI-like enzyme